jgi:hypothetical protein
MSNIFGEVFGIAHDDYKSLIDKSIIEKMITQMDNDIIRCLAPTSMAMPQIVYTKDPPIVQQSVPVTVDYSISFESEDLEPVEPKRPKRLMVLDE